MIIKELPEKKGEKEKRINDQCGNKFRPKTEQCPVRHPKSKKKFMLRIDVRRAESRNSVLHFKISCTTNNQSHQTHR